MTFPRWPIKPYDPNLVEPEPYVKNPYFFAAHNSFYAYLWLSIVSFYVLCESQDLLLFQRVLFSENSHSLYLLSYLFG